MPYLFCLPLNKQCNQPTSTTNINKNDRYVIILFKKGVAAEHFRTKENIKPPFAGLNATTCTHMAMVLGRSSTKWIEKINTAGKVQMCKSICFCFSLSLNTQHSVVPSTLMLLKVLSAIPFLSLFSLCFVQIQIETFMVIIDTLAKCGIYRWGAVLNDGWWLLILLNDRLGLL